MTDCPNAEIRDLLPDYVHDRLSPADLAQVEQHLVTCAECTEELALLQQIFDVRPAVAAIDVAAIVASLPRPAALAPSGSSSHDSPSVRDIASARSAVRKAGAFRGWRAAAALAVVAVGSLSVAVARQSSTGSDMTTRVGDKSNVLASNPAIPSAGRLDSAPAAPAPQVSLSVGDMSDYSDEEMQAIMARLDKWDGAASTDPLPGIPILPPGS